MSRAELCSYRRDRKAEHAGLVVEGASNGISTHSSAFRDGIDNACKSRYQMYHRNQAVRCVMKKRSPRR